MDAIFISVVGYVLALLMSVIGFLMIKVMKNIDDSIKSLIRRFEAMEEGYENLSKDFYKLLGEHYAIHGGRRAEDVCRRTPGNL